MYTYTGGSKMAITCDLCGGTIEMKTGGNAVCTSCGMTYSMESLREKLKGGQSNLPVSTPAQPATTSSPSWISSTLKMAQMNLNNNDNHKAIEACDKVLSADFSNSEAWEIKIQASSMPEAAEALREYYGTATTEADRKRIIDFAEKYFATINTVEGADILYQVCPSAASKMVTRTLKDKIDFERKYTADFKKACSKEQSNRPSSDDRYNMDFDRTLDSVRYVLRNNSGTFDFLEKCTSFNSLKGVDISYSIISYTSACKEYLDAVKGAKRWYACSSTSNRTYLSGQYYIDSSTYSHALEPIFTSTSWEADAIRAQLGKLNSFEKKANAKISLIQSQKEAEKKARIKAYWDNNKERKEELELQKIKFNANIQREKAELQTSSEANALKEAKNKVVVAKDKLESLGFFAFKEKKQLEAEILQLECQVSTAMAAYNSKQSSIDRKINKLQEQIEQINRELTMDRNVELPPPVTEDEDDEDYITQIVLFGPGNNKLEIIKMLNNLCGLSYNAAKEIVETPNSIFTVPDDSDIFEKVIQTLIENEADYELV